MSAKDSAGNEYRVIDADGHAWEFPFERWDTYLPESLRGKVWRMGLDPNGHQRILFDGNLSMAHETGNVPDEEIVRRALLRPAAPGEQFELPTGGRASFETVPRGHPEDPDLHVQDLDVEGIDVSVVYPSLALIWLSTTKLDLAIACARAQNRIFAEHRAAHPDRLKPVTCLPLVVPTKECVDACLCELDFAANELDLRTAVHFMPSVKKTNLDDPVFFPLYAEIERLGLPIGIHWSAGTHLSGIEERFRPEQFFVGHTLGFPIENMIALGSIVCGGILERFPALHWAVLESGCGWVYYLMERLDDHWERVPQLVPQMRRWPRDYMKSGLIYYSFDPDEASLPFVLEMMGDDLLVYASDYPHWDGRYPDTLSPILENPKLRPEQKQKILCENAKRLYRL